MVRSAGIQRHRPRGRQERRPLRSDAHASDRRNSRAARFRDDRRCLSQLHRGERARAEAAQAAGGISQRSGLPGRRRQRHPADGGRCRVPGADRGGDSRRLPGIGKALWDGESRGRRAQQRHRGGLARGQLRGTTGKLSQHQRGIRAAEGVPQMLRVPVHRSRHRLPRDPRLRSSASRAVHRHPKNGPLRSCGVRRDVHARHRNRLPRRGRHQCGLGTWRKRRPGHREPGQICGLQTAAGGPAAHSDHREIDWHQGEKTRLWRGGKLAHAQHPDHPPGTRSDRAVRRGNSAARALGARRRAASWPADGHGVGEGRREQRDVSRPGAPRNGPVGQVGDPAQNLQPRSQGQAHRERRSHRRSHFHRQRMHDPQRQGHRSVPRGIDPGDGVHRPGLGADHEEGGRAHHQPRRHHQPRGHREPRARAAGHRGNVARHRVDPGWTADHALLRGGRARGGLRGHPGIQDERGRSFRSACDSYRDDGQHRQSLGGISLVAPARQGDRPRADGVHHQQHHQDPPDGVGALRRRAGSGRPPSDRGIDARLSGQGCVLRRYPGQGHRQDRGSPSSESRHRASQRLQEQRIRPFDRRRAIRDFRGESDARIARRLALLQRSLSGWVCAGMPGDMQGAAGNRLRQPHRHGALLPHAAGGRPGAVRHGRTRIAARARTACRSM